MAHMNVRYCETTFTERCPYIRYIWWMRCKIDANDTTQTKGVSHEGSEFKSLFAEEDISITKIYNPSEQSSYLYLDMVPQEGCPFIVCFLITSTCSLHGVFTTMELETKYLLPGTGPNKKIEFSSEWLRDPEIVIQSIEDVFRGPELIKHCYSLVYEKRKEIMAYLASHP